MPRVRTYIIALGIALLFPVIASAEVTPSVGGVDTKVLEEELRSHRSLRIPIRLFGMGRVEAKLETTGKAGALTLYEGSVEGRGFGSVASATLDSRTRSLRLRFAREDRRGKRTYYSVHLSPRSSRVRVIRGPEVVLKTRGCGLPKQRTEAVMQSSAKAITTVKEVEVAFDADTEYRSRLTTGFPEHVAELVHSVNVFYQRDLGLSVKATKVNPQTTQENFPSSMTNSELLLERFASIANGSRYLGRTDVSLLLTGKTLEQEVIGLAYFETACLRPLEAFALAQRVNDAVDHIIVAHELGHTLGADHSDDGGIMTVALADSIPDAFSATSKTEIGNFVRRYGSCLTQRQLTPTPTPTSTPATTPTITPTPALSPTPSPSPTATPTPGVAASPRFSLKLKREGEIEGSIAVNDSGQLCHILLLSTDRSGSFNKATALATLSGASTSYTLKGKIRARVKPAGTIPSLYLMVQHVCPGRLSAESKVVRINPRSVRKGRSLALQTWKSRFYRAIKVG